MITKISDKLRNYKGVTLITLIIAITIFAIFITVFSYVMVAKHGASALYVQSTQAYAVAQAGIEYGIRYATGDDNGATFLADPDSFFPGTAQDFGNGSFTLEYNSDTLTSTGNVGVAERAIILASFSSYVEAAGPGEIDLGGPASRSTKTINVPLENNYGDAVDIYNITLAKTGSQITLQTIKFDGATVWSGNQSVSATPTVFTFNYTMAQGPVTLSLTASKVPGLSGTSWDCTVWYNPSDPQSSSVSFTIP